MLKTFTPLNLSEGDQVTVCIRPGATHLSIHRIQPGKNVFSGIIDSIHPIGRDFEIKC